MFLIFVMFRVIYVFREIVKMFVFDSVDSSFSNVIDIDFILLMLLLMVSMSISSSRNFFFFVFLFFFFVLLFIRTFNLFALRTLNRFIIIVITIIITVGVFENDILSTVFVHSDAVRNFVVLFKVTDFIG